MSFLLGAKAQSKQTATVGAFNLQTSALGKCVALCYGTNILAPNLIWYDDFNATPVSNSANAGKGGVGGGGGGKGGGGTSQYTYSVSVQMGLCEGPIVGFGTVWKDKNIITPAELGMDTFLGTYPQSPWAYLTTAHPLQAIGYNGIVHADVSNYQLGNSPQLSNHNFELMTIFSNSVGVLVDADASLIIPDILSNPYHGAGYPSGKVGDLSAYQDYVLASGLLISPFYTDQSACASMLQDIAVATNSEFVGATVGALTLVPYGDATITGNGHTYTPPAAPLFDLDDDDFVYASGTDPVQLDRKRISDSLNDLKLEYLDRSNQYNTAIAEAKDQASIDTYGLRPSNTITAHMFCDATFANTSVQLQLQRQSIQNTYTVTVKRQYIVLDEMDIVTLTDPRLNLNKQWVRIKQIDENDDYSLTMICEEYLAGTGTAAEYSFQPGEGTVTDYNSPPGDANAPVIFELPVQISYSGGLEVDLAASGGSNWGGCDVWISPDGDNYKLAGRVTGPARMGVLSAPLPFHDDPDTTDTAHVDLSESLGVLVSGTKDDADNFHTICWVGNEVISYETATLITSYNFDLTYLRRGGYGTVIAAHATNSQFCRLDEGIFAYPYDKSKVGSTIYIKLTSFNIYGGGEQNLSDVEAIPYLIQGPPLPANVTGFTGQQSGASVAFKWNDIPNDVGLKGYDIAYGAVGSDWSEKTLLTEATRGTEMTNAAVPPGLWEFSIRAHDIADNLSPSAESFTLTVTNPNPIIAEADQEPDWIGTLVNFYKHYTGVLTPLSSKIADQYPVISMPSAPTLGSVVGGALGPATYYVKISYVDSTGETLASAESSLLVLASFLLTVASPPSVSGAVGYNIYVDTTSGAETLQNASPINIGAAWTQPSSGLVSGIGVPTENSTGWQVFDKFVPDPVMSASYTAPMIDTALDSSVRVFATIAYGLGFGQTGTPAIGLQIDTWLTGGVDTGVYENWTIGYVTMRYLNARLNYPTIIDGDVAYITKFEPTVDTAPLIENSSAGGVAVAAIVNTSGNTISGSAAVSSVASFTGISIGKAIIGAGIPAGTTVISTNPGAGTLVMSANATATASSVGLEFTTWITFPQAYHTIPDPQVTPISGTAKYGSATNITTLGFTPLLWDSSGNSVSGTVSWSATGY